MNMCADENSSGLPILNWIDGPIKKSFQSVFDGLNTSTEALDIFKKFRNNHFKTLLKKVSLIKILGMSEPIPILDVYSPTYVSTTIHSRLYETNWYSQKGPVGRDLKDTKKSKDVICGDVFIEDHDRIVVLGSAGSGKTTFLKYLALAYSDKRVFKSSKLKTSKLPIYISMNSYTNEFEKTESIFKYIADSLRRKTNDFAEHYISRILKKGLAVVFLDALDEVPKKYRKNVFDKINEFADDYPDVKIVLTCRTADYDEPFETFYEVEVVKLNKNAIEKIVKGWFKDDRKNANLLLRHLEHDKDVLGLSETPLLLSLLCIQFRHDLTLPKRKTELYRRCIDTFLRDWDTSRGFRRTTAYESLSDERKHRIFESIAGKYTKSDQITLIFPEEELNTVVGDCCLKFGILEKECSNVLSEIEQHHGIVERYSKDSFIFSHPSIQEYFAARFFIAERNDFDVLKDNFSDTQWFNIIEFLVSMHPGPDRIFEFLISNSEMKGLKTYPAMARRTKILWLIYRCLSVEPYINQELRERCYKHIFRSQLEIAKIYGEGRIFPIAVLMKNGVRHTYYYIDRIRPTLREALQPLRWLSNEILLSPSEYYSQLVWDYIEKHAFNDKMLGNELLIANLLTLCIPISSSKPKNIKKFLEKIIREKGKDIIARFSKESLDVIDIW